MIYEYIYWFGLLDNFSNSEFAQIMYLHSPLNFYHLTPSARTRDFDLFDDIILPSNGQIVNQGPRKHELDFLNPWALNVLKGKVWLTSF